MAINQAALEAALLSLFQSPPASIAACAQQWASAVQTGAAGVVPPSTTVSAAAGTLQSQLASAFATPNAIPAMEAAFTAFGAAVGLGMVPLYTAVPPPGPVGFVALCNVIRDTHAQAASDFAAAIAAWLKTGTAALVAPPNTVVPWT